VLESSATALIQCETEASELEEDFGYLWQLRCDRAVVGRRVSEEDSGMSDSEPELVNMTDLTCTELLRCLLLSGASKPDSL